MRTHGEQVLWQWFFRDVYDTDWAHRSGTTLREGVIGSRRDLLLEDAQRGGAGWHDRAGSV